MNGVVKIDNNKIITPYMFISEQEAEQRKEALPSRDIAYLSDLFKMFGDGTRLQILYLLRSGELCVGDIAAIMDMTPSAISHQLKLLRSSELVKFRRDGKTLLYSLADEHVNIITDTGLEHIRE